MVKKTLAAALTPKGVKMTESFKEDQRWLRVL